MNSTFFDATDWLTMTYKYKNWSVSAGKQVVAIGGYEYDRPPIDIYFASEYWNNIACYQIGVSGAYTTTDGKDQVLFQFCESPFRKKSTNVLNEEMFAYNLMWYGNHGFFNSMYSLNFIEYLPGKFINYIALGNRFSFGKFALELDIMNRAMSGAAFWANDFSVIGELSWKPIEVEEKNMNLEEKPIFQRILDALLDGGRTGVDVGLAIIPGVVTLAPIQLCSTH